MKRHVGVVGAAALITALTGFATAFADPGLLLSVEAPPGAVWFPEALGARLAVALAAKGPGYVARAAHRRPDGAPRFTNRLILETSPYLLQHAHNPVNWYAWGDEAFETARRLGRPVLLSIGYSTCYWCHVMERESFEDLEIARYLNEHYVAIKVDREERPDLDDLYMSAVQAMTGRGGWPMTTWLTPDRKPFYGGTYFPPRDGARGSRTGFLTLLRRFADSYDRSPRMAAERAARIAAAVETGAVPAPGSEVPGPSVLTAVYKGFATSFDEAFAGFGMGAKFPRPVVLGFLMRYGRRTGDEGAARMVARTLDAMASGGLRDHVGGGFHRYATDRRWAIPHFEKMLYDNALLAAAYVEAYEATGDERWAGIVRETLDYLDRDMSAPEGGFHSATDAEAIGHEGDPYVWTPARMTAALGPVDGPLVARYWGVTPGGNFEGGRTVLHVPMPSDKFAAANGMTPEVWRARLVAAKAKLLAARRERPQPLMDTKVLAAWNGLAVSAFARAGRALAEPRYAARAGRAMDFLLTRLAGPKGLGRSWSEGRASHAGTLEDYAFVIAGLLDLFEADPRPRWIEAARTLQREQDARFGDPAAGGYFMAAAGTPGLIARGKPWADYALPSGNSVSALNLLRLAEWTADDAYGARARALLTAFGSELGRSPTEAPWLAAALDFQLDRPKEILILRPRAPKGKDDDARAAAMARALAEAFLPNAVVLTTREGPALASLRPSVAWLEGKRAIGARTTAYVCERHVCELPTSDPARFAAQIAKVDPL